MSTVRVLLLMPTTTYRAEDFLGAARRLGVEVAIASDRCARIAAECPEAARGALPVRFDDPAGAVRAIVEAARARPVAAIVPVDDVTAVVAAEAAALLGLRANPVEAVRAARDKRVFREALARAGLPHPRFRALRIEETDPRAAAAAWARAPGWPCVLKPAALAASQGVIRADGPEGFAAAFERIARLLRSPDIAVRRDPALEWIIAEEFLPGPEFAVEGLLRGGELAVLALFDKPDPLEGPFFEETIYVTPSRTAAGAQEAIAGAVAAAARALGLREGPIHAEVRLHPERGPVAIEVAARSIGGLCSRTLRFGTGLTLEEVILAHALGREVSLDRERRAAGVMMIPIPRAGFFRGVEGVEEARAVHGIEEVAITHALDADLVPLPEGACYLGFIFARGDDPAAVEAALREAHRRLRFDVATRLPAVDVRKPRGAPSAP